MLRIEITALDPGVHRFSLQPKPEDLDLDAERFSNVRVEVELHFEIERILVFLKARAEAMLECDRTLQAFEQEICGDYALLFARPEEIDGGEAHEGFEAVLPLTASDREIDLTAPVRDTLLLAIPQRCVAPGAEDLEIQTRFGAPVGGEADIDPRWEALRKLRSGGGEASQ